MILDEDFNEEQAASMEDIKEFIHSDEFKESVVKASEEHVNILNELKPEMKDAKEEFVEYMLHGCEHLDKSELRDMKRKFNKAFKKLVDYKHYQGGYPKPTSEAKIKKMVDDFEIALKYFDYIGSDLLRKELEGRGIYIDDNISSKLENDYPHLNKESSSNLKSIIEDAATCQGNICKKKDEINENIFEDAVPDELKYSSYNKNGLKISAFNKLATINAMKKVKDKESMEKYVNNMTENSIFNVAREELLQEAIEEVK